MEYGGAPDRYIYVNIDCGVSGVACKNVIPNTNFIEYWE